MESVTALGRDIPNRHDQVADADRWLLPKHRPKIQIHYGLSPDNLEDRRDLSVHARIGSNSHSASGLLFQSNSGSFYPRSPFANGATFLGFEMAMRLLK